MKTITDKKSIIKAILAVSLVFGLVYYIYFETTIFEHKDLRRGKATVHETIPKKVVNQQGILGKEHNVTQRLQERLCSRTWFFSGRFSIPVTG